MPPSRRAPAELLALLPEGGRVLVTGASGESLLLAKAVMAAGDTLGAKTFTGIFVPGVNRHSYLANAECRVETFFVTPELRPDLGGRVTHYPFCYNEIRSEEHTSELQSLMRISYAVFCLKKKTIPIRQTITLTSNTTTNTI